MVFKFHSIYTIKVPDTVSPAYTLKVLEESGPALSHSVSKQQTYSVMDPLAEGPSGNIACIFTDIIDSTNLWEFHETQMWQAIQLHNLVIRKEIADFTGYEVKTCGDSFHIVFSDASSALRFCLSSQLALHLADWPPGIKAYGEQKEVFEETGSEIAFKGISVRMGIHCGTPYAAALNPVAQRMDYYGPMVNSSARVQEQANGGEIAVSDAFIVAVWRRRNRAVDPNIALTDELRAHVLKREVSLEQFELKFKGWCYLKGCAEQMYITLISCRHNTESVSDGGD